MCAYLRTSALAVAALLVGLRGAEADVPMPRPRPLVVTLDSPMKCLAGVVYTEARSESDEGQLMVAFVAYMRALLDLPGTGGPTICGVAFAERQFDGVKARTFVAHEPAAWNRALLVAYVVVTKRFVPKGEIRYATHYLVPEKSGEAGRCWFERTLVPIAFVGAHRFYRMPLHYEKPQPSKQCAPNAARMAAK